MKALAEFLSFNSYREQALILARLYRVQQVEVNDVSWTWFTNALERFAYGQVTLTGLCLAMRNVQGSKAIEVGRVPFGLSELGFSPLIEEAIDTLVHSFHLQDSFLKSRQYSEITSEWKEITEYVEVDASIYRQVIEQAIITGTINQLKNIHWHPTFLALLPFPDLRNLEGSSTVLTPEQVDQEVDSLFISPYAKLIYALVYATGHPRPRLLGITNEIFNDLEKGEAWFKEREDILTENGRRDGNWLKPSHQKAVQALQREYKSILDWNEAKTEDARKEEANQARRKAF